MKASTQAHRESGECSRATDDVGSAAGETAGPPIPNSSQTRLRTADVAREAEVSGIELTTPLCDVQPLEREPSLLNTVLPAPLPANETDSLLPNPEHAHAPAARPAPTPSEIPSPQSAPMTAEQNAIAALFGGIAGYVDTVGFMTLYGMFTAHITGDIVASVAELSDGGIVTKVMMLPIFVISVAMATMLTRATRRKGEAALFPLLALMTVALTAFGAAGILLRPFMTGPADLAVGFVGATGVAAMAIQNMIMRDALKTWTPTTIMTGNLTQATIQLVEMMIATREADPRDRARIRSEAKRRLTKFGLPLAGFVCGAALGAFLTRMYGFWSIALPAAVVGAMTVWHWRAAHR